MDLIMPDMSGIEAVQAIHQLPTLNDEQMVIIATSANVFEEVQLQSKLVGCHDFLAKPIVVEKLLKILETRLSLQWIYKEPTSGGNCVVPEKSKDDIAGLIPPPPKEIIIWYDLAMKGDLSRLRKRAIHLKQTNEKFTLFVQKLCRLIDNIDEDQILILLEQYKNET
jgi:CheY-like chemotaxis protein